MTSNNNFILIIFISLSLCSFLVIWSQNSINATLYLILVYLLIAILYLILGAEFLAILLLIVYVGAISILFLFVVMLLNLRILEYRNLILDYYPIGIFTFFFMSYFIFEFNGFDFFNPYGSELYGSELIDYTRNINGMNNLFCFAEVLFTTVPLYLLLVGLLLFAALICCVCLTMNLKEKELNNKKSSIYLNNTRSKINIK